MTPTRRLLGPLTVCTLLLAACGESTTTSTAPAPTPGGPTTTRTEDSTMTSTPAPDVRLVAEASAGPLGGDFPAGVTGMTVRYTVTNDGDRPLLVLTERAHDQNPDSPTPSGPDAAWVGGVDGQPDVAQLSKQVFGVPAGVLPTQPWRGAATVVQPGGSSRGTMKVRLPLRPDLPSSQNITVDEPPLPTGATRFQVCVQVAPLPSGTAPSEITHLTPGRALACSAPAELPTLAG